MSLAWLNRSEMLLGAENMQKLRECRVCIIGLGGVGSYATEALVRAGIGRFVLIDFDDVGLTNLNRQIIALDSTIGQAKTEVMKERILAINPQAEVTCHKVFLDKENRPCLLQNCDYYIDAIDSLGPKIGLLEYAIRNDLKIITVMGAGNRIDPTQIKLGSLNKSINCPLARRARKALRRNGIKPDIPAVYSTELPLLPTPNEDDSLDELTIQRGRQRQPIGSISYMPAIMGMMAASWVVRAVAEPPC
ncbi:MAG: tRNA threonylcarbamoyladenosine dehydratase [Candidatus Cloacimonadaceae bacterium]|jgi:tRNA A37 threonylcarbamoyladenosine dehydratase